MSGNFAWTQINSFRFSQESWLVHCELVMLFSTVVTVLYWNSVEHDQTASCSTVTGSCSHKQTHLTSVTVYSREGKIIKAFVNEFQDFFFFFYLFKDLQGTEFSAFRDLQIPWVLLLVAFPNMTRATAQWPEHLQCWEAERIFKDLCFKSWLLEVAWIWFKCYSRHVG